MKMTGGDANSMQVPTAGMPLISMNSPMRLDSWKDIASYLKRSVRTVQRWERIEGMPVHRHAHSNGESLFAYTYELDAWRNSRSHAGPKQVAVPSVQRPIHSLMLEEQAGLRRLLEAVLEQLGKAPLSSEFVVVFHGTLGHSGNKGLGSVADPRIAGDINGSRVEPHPFLPEVQ
jgi:hypothetical protein